jgi:hypothetical protein
MSQDQITGLLRVVLSALGGFVVAKGWLPSATWDWIAGGAAVAAPAVWSWIANRPASIAASAQALPGVTVTTTAAAAPSVVASVAAAKATP